MAIDNHTPIKGLPCTCSMLLLPLGLSHFLTTYSEIEPPAGCNAQTDGGGFEPPVPFGTHAFQACTINRSVTHPEQSSSSSES